MFLQLGVNQAPASPQKNSQSSPAAYRTPLYPTAHRYFGFGPNSPNLAQPELSHLYAKTQAAGNPPAGAEFPGRVFEASCVSHVLGLSNRWERLGSQGHISASSSFLRGGQLVLMPLWFETDHNKPLPLPMATSEATAAKRRVGFTRKGCISRTFCSSGKNKNRSVYQQPRYVTAAIPKYHQACFLTY